MRSRGWLNRIAARAAAGAWLLAAGIGSAAAAPSEQLSVTGAVQTPRTYDLAGLQARPAVTQTVEFVSGAGTQTHTYVGTSLWDTLNDSGIIVDPAVRNNILNRYVLATGSDGYRAVFSLGEINPGFGNQPNLIAYAEVVGGITEPLGSNGFARVTVPGDLRGGRYVSNLVNFDVRESASTKPSLGGGPSTLFTVSGEVQNSMSFDAMTDWAALGLTEVTQTVSYLSGSTPQTRTYSGYLLWDLLNSSAIGLVTDPAVRNDILNKYVVATGTDGYKAVFAMGEIDPGFGGRDYFIALEEVVNGVSVPLSDADGFARVVVPGDVRGGRYVSNLYSLEVFSAAPVPEPHTWALLAAGLAMLLVSRRRATH